MKGSRDPQGSWGLADPKELWAGLDLTASQGPADCQGRLGPPGTGASQEKPWVPSPGPGETLACQDTPG